MDRKGRENGYQITKICNMKFRIKITEDIIDESLTCGTGPKAPTLHENCAFAKAYQKLIPNTVIADRIIFQRERTTAFENIELLSIPLTPEQQHFVVKFDSFWAEPGKRYSLVGQEFDIEIPDEIIEHYYQDKVEAAKEILSSEVLELIEP